MGATIAVIAAPQLIDRTADAPCIVATNVIEDSASGFPLANLDSAFTTADGSDASYPVARLADRNRATLWKYGSSQSTVYVLFDAGVGQTLKADCILWEGRVKTWSATAQLRVRASDTLDGSDMLLNATTITTISGPFATNIHAELWSSSYEARYWEIRISNTAAIVHQLSQLCLGIQTQFNYKSDTPYDPTEVMSDYDEEDTIGGMSHRVTRYYGRKRRRGLWWFRTAEAQDALLAAFAKTAGWAKPFWYIEDPTTDETDAIYGSFMERGLYLPSEIGVEGAIDEWLEQDFRENLPRGESAVS